MAKKPIKPSVVQPTEAPPQKQIMQDDGSEAGAENFADINPAGAQNFADIKPVDK
jgi:hypothetical protein